jgi:hypothetical protein
MPRKTKKGDPKHILQYLKTHKSLSEEEAQKITVETGIARKAAKQRNTKPYGFGIQKEVGPFTAEDELKPQTDEPTSSDA